MTRNQERSSNLVVNLPELLTRIDNDRELLRELVDIFNAEFPRLLKLLQEQIGRTDWKQIEFTSHGLKGMLGGLSAIRAAATAAMLEQMARNRDLTGVADAVNDLEREAAKVAPELEATMAGTKP